MWVKYGICALSLRDPAQLLFDLRLELDYQTRRIRGKALILEAGFEIKVFDE